MRTIRRLAAIQIYTLIELNMSKKENKITRVLCIDHEGGRGGSSKSLFESLNAIDRQRIITTVWCRRDSHLLAGYKKLGIATRIVPDWPRFTPLDRILPSLLALMVSTFQFIRFFIWRQALLHELRANFDVVHFNHENLFPLAWLIRRFANMPISMHVRTVQFDTALSRWQTKLISRTADYLFFISANEQRTFQSRGGRTDRQAVLINIVNPVEDGSPKLSLPQGDNLIVASVGNFSLEQGTDRLMELARILKDWNRTDIHFLVAGQMSLPSRMRRQLPHEARSARTLSEYAKMAGLDDYFTFLGHISNPQAVLATANVGIKLNRLKSNWGRDMLEALAAGVPIIAVGTDRTFVRPGDTGLLFDDFQAEEICQALIDLKDSPAELVSMRLRAKTFAQEVIDPQAHGNTLMGQWQEMHRNGRAAL